MLPPPLTPQPPNLDSGDFSRQGCRFPPDPPPVTINRATHGASRLRMKNDSETLTATFCNRFITSQVREVLCSSTLVHEKRKKDEPTRFKKKGNRHPSCEIHWHRKTNPYLGALPQPRWLTCDSGWVAAVLKQHTPTFRRRVTRTREFFEPTAT